MTEDELELAECRGVRTVDFYPERGASLRPAQRLCERCPVRGACLAEAQARPEWYGVWGGLGERQRRRMRRA